MAEEINNKETSKHIEKGSIIYQQGNSVQSICVILKGRVLIQNESIRSVVGTGSFLGVYDAYKGTYQSTYTAIDNLVVVQAQVQSAQDIPGICERYNGYGGLLTSYLSRRIKSLYSTYQHMKEEIVQIREFLEVMYQEYQKQSKEHHLDCCDIQAIRSFDDACVMPLPYMDEIKYYIACAEIPIEVQKQFFSANKAIYMRHIEEQQNLIDHLYQECSMLTEEIKKVARALVLDHVSIYTCTINLALSLSKIGEDNTFWVDQIDTVIDKINGLDNLCIHETGYNMNVNREKMEKEYFILLSGHERIDEVLEQPKNVRSLEHSLDLILDYSGMEVEFTQTFRENIKKFIQLSDKFSKDSDIMELRRAITKSFYGLYSHVFRNAITDSHQPYAIELFLKYGFISEELLSEEHLEEMIQLEDQSLESTPCTVYTLYDWLKAIYFGEKEPSKNEFDLDYDANIREQLKNNQITKKEAIQLQIDMDKKLQYEIDNMVRSNHRLLSEQVTSFVPILFSEGCNLGLKRTLLTSYRCNRAIKKINQIDFTLFSRELIFSDQKAGIVKDYVIKEIYPDIVLFPCYGSRGTMWQEITGRKRDTPGRFMFPIFLETDELSAMLPIIGRFRWEMCRTIQGMKWNDIREKSLTSEYQDYIQFFRKNNSLSEEWKEKIRNQIKASRNNTKEIFTRDYIEWVTRESTGGVRLNKVSREILSTYCPFNKEIRERITLQPLFAEGMKRFQIEWNKSSRNYENKCNQLIRSGIEVPKELIETRDFYRQ